MPPLPFLADLAKRAGAKVLTMQADVSANRNGEKKYKPDGSIVTIGDEAANELICAALRERFPGIAIVSEENPEEEIAAALQAEERFDIDPIDNTRLYATNRDGFSVNIGRISHGVPVAGAVHFPALGELYFTGDDNKAYFQKGDAAPVEISVTDAHTAAFRALRVAVDGNPNLRHLGAWRHKAEKRRYSGQLRTCMIARGVCDISGLSIGSNGGYNCWDVAGPHAVLLAAGGEVVCIDGPAWPPMRYQKGAVKVPPHAAGARWALRQFNMLDEPTAPQV